MDTTPNTMARAAVSSILSRMNHHSDEITNDLNRHSYIRGMTLLEIARMALQEKGSDLTRGIINHNELINRAMTSSDFPAILKDIANKNLESTYQYAPSTYEKWTSRGSVKDFKLSTIARLSPPADLPEVLENGEFQHLTLKDGEEDFKLKTYGGIVGLSRVAIINDDLSMFADVSKIMGQVSKMSQNRKVYTYLMSNPTLSDDVAVFDASRGNYLSGATTALSKDSLALAVKTMRMMGDDNGNILSVEPKFLLVGPSLEMTAHELCYSDSIPGQSNPAVPNLFKKIGLTPIVEPLLESPAITGNSSTAWYLFPDPLLWSTFRVFALGKNFAPYLDSLESWDKDQIEYKVRIDFGSAAIGKFAVMSKGAA